MNQIGHAIVAQLIVSAIWHFFLRDYLRVKAEDDYWSEAVEKFFDKYF